MEIAGSICFGIVIGWVTYRTLRRKDGTTLADISGVIGALGGAAITSIFGTKDTFYTYAIGLFIGFFAYLIVAANVKTDDSGVGSWMDRTENKK